MKTQTDKQVDELEYQIQDLTRKVAELRRQRPREEVSDVALLDVEGREASLASLFGRQNRLILVHNMGRNCSYCAMWADGFVSLLPYLTSRAAFVLTSPDKPELLKAFAHAHGWNFPVYSTAGSTFTRDMGFDDEKEGYMPGVSVFTREDDGTIYRVSRAEFAPGDNFCSVWHFFDLLPEGVDGWEPDRAYQSSPQAQLVTFP